MLLSHKLKALDESFPTVSWLTIGYKYWPQTSQSTVVILLLLTASVILLGPSSKIYSTISQPHLGLKPYHWFVYGLNSLFVWFQHRVWLADGTVSWWHNTMSNRRKEGCIGGLFSPLLSTFWCCCSKKTLSMCIVLIWCYGGCGKGAILVAAFFWWQQQYQCNASMTHCALNSLIGTITDKIF